MRGFLELVTSPVGKKVQVAAAGLLLCGFLVSHLAGNLLIWGGAESYNHYAIALERNMLLPIAEVLLAGLFLLHVAAALRVRYENRQARPIGYQVRAWAGGRTVTSAGMLWSGLLLLAFIVVHVRTMRLMSHGEDLYGFVLQKFQSVPYAAFYVAAMAALALHLAHGFQAAFRTFGLENPRYALVVSRMGWAFAAVISGGFAAIVIWAASRGTP